MVGGIRDKDVPRAAHRQPRGVIEPRGAAGAIRVSRAGAVGRIIAPGHAGQGRDDSREGDFPDRVVSGIRDVDISRAIGGHALRPAEPGGIASAIRTSGVGSGACDGGDHPGRRDPADEVDVRVGHVEIAGRADRNPSRILEACVAAGAIG